MSDPTPTLIERLRAMLDSDHLALEAASALEAKDAEIQKLRRGLERCISNAGHPEAEQGCWNVIKTAQKALKRNWQCPHCKVINPHDCTCGFDE